MRLPGDLVYRIIHDEYLFLTRINEGLLQVQKLNGISSGGENEYGSYMHVQDMWLKAYIPERAHFASLCLVSRLFYDIAQPLLYRSFRNEDAEIQNADPRLELFLRTILDRPDLANKVRRVELNVLCTSESARSSFSLNCSKNEWSEVSEQVDAASQQSTGTVWNRSSGSRLKLLLTLCTRIETIHMVSVMNYAFLRYVPEHQRSKPYCDEDDRLQPISSTSDILFPAQRALDCEQLQPTDLKLLTYDHIPDKDVDEEYCSFWALESCLRSPQLTRLCVTRSRLSRSLLSEKPPTHPGLTVVNLRNSVWTSIGVRDLLRYSPTLKVLKLISSIFENGSDWSDWDLDFPALGKVLRQYGTRLTHLTVDARGAFGYETDETEYEHLLGDLKSLVSLRELCIPLVQLLTLSDKLKDDYFELERQVCLESSSELSTLLKKEVLPDSIATVHLLDHFHWNSKSSLLLEYES